MMFEEDRSRDDVLDDFAVEPRHDRTTLERYIGEYPQHAVALEGLSRELSRETTVQEDALSDDDLAFIDAAWRQHSSVTRPLVDPLAGMNVEEQRRIARDLNVPRNVFTALKDRRVIVSTIPARVLKRLATLRDATLDSIVASLALPPATMSRSYKADGKPGTSSQIAFEQLLIEAKLSPSERAALLEDDA